MGARAGKYKLGARAGKYKLGSRAGKYKLGARVGGQAKGRGPGNINRGQLIEDIKELNSRCDIINREIHAIGGKTQVRKEEVRVKLKLFETYLMPALLYGMEAWKKLS